ncbi:hypothetical protein ACS0TY_027072 [Phlomoides rotata]
MKHVGEATDEKPKVIKKKSKEIKTLESERRRDVADATDVIEEAKAPKKLKSKNVSKEEGKSAEKPKVIKKKSIEIKTLESERRRDVADATDVITWA